MWLCGCVVVWLCGCVVVWPCGCVTVWLCDRVAVWLCGYVAVWLCGRVAVLAGSRGKGRGELPPAIVDRAILIGAACIKQGHLALAPFRLLFRRHDLCRYIRQHGQ